MQNESGAHGARKRRRDSPHHSWSDSDIEKLRMGVATYQHQWDKICEKMFSDIKDMTPSRCTAKWAQLLRGVYKNVKFLITCKIRTL